MLLATQQFLHVQTQNLPQHQLSGSAQRKAQAGFTVRIDAGLRMLTPDNHQVHW